MGFFSVTMTLRAKSKSPCSLAMKGAHWSHHDVGSLKTSKQILWTHKWTWDSECVCSSTYLNLYFHLPQFLPPINLSSLPKSEPPFWGSELCHVSFHRRGWVPMREPCFLRFVWASRMSDVSRTLGVRSNIILYPTIFLIGGKLTYFEVPRQYAESATGMAAKAMPIWAWPSGLLLMNRIQSKWRKGLWFSGGVGALHALGFGFAFQQHKRAKKGGGMAPPQLVYKDHLLSFQQLFPHADFNRASWQLGRLLGKKMSIPSSRQPQELRLQVTQPMWSWILSTTAKWIWKRSCSS